MIWGYYYFLSRPRLDVDLDNSCCIQKYLSLLQTTLKFVFFHTPNQAWPRKTEVDSLNCIANCVTDNSSKF